MIQKYNIRNCIYLGKVFHTRLKPKKHSFNYNVFYLNIELKEFKKKKLPFFLSYNKLNIFSLYDKDHGPLNCTNIDAWIRNLIKINKIKEDIKKIYLLTFPRVLGYVFNPLSVYSCLDKNNQIVIQIYEVHNTFNQRFFYIVKNSFLKKNHKNVYKKKFHVSPFLSMKGSYKFKSFWIEKKLSLIVEYFSKNEKFFASFTGTERKLNNLNLILYFFKIPFMTLKIIIGIHFEAIILYIKGVKFYKCPRPHNINFIKYFRNNKWN